MKSISCKLNQIHPDCSSETAVHFLCWHFLDCLMLAGCYGILLPSTHMHTHLFLAHLGFLLEFVDVPALHLALGSQGLLQCSAKVCRDRWLVAIFIRASENNVRLSFPNTVPNINSLIV